MTVSEYVKKHPKTILAKRLAKKFGADSKKQIWVGSGIVQGGGGYGFGSSALGGGYGLGSSALGTNSPQSNIGRMIKRYNPKGYIVGGRAGYSARDGNYFALYK